MLLLRARHFIYRVFFSVSFSAFFALSPVHAQGDGLNAQPTPGKALVFVFRKDRVHLPAPVQVHVNSKKLGQLTNNSYTSITVAPGTAKILIGDLTPSKLDLIAAANQRYFVRVDAIYGVTVVRTEVQLVSEQEGLNALGQSRFTGDATPAITAVAAPLSASAPNAAAPSLRAAQPLNQTAATTAPPPKPLTSAPNPSSSNRAQTVSTPSSSPRTNAANTTASIPTPVPRSAEPTKAQTPTSPEAGSKYEFAFIVNTGSFTLSKSSQVLGGLSSTYDAASKSVLSAQAEWRDPTGLALGGEIFTYSNDIATSSSSTDAQQSALIFLANSKYYFRSPGTIRPFVGAGLGYASATYSGNLTGSATGLAYQGVAGAELRFNRMFLHLQYKYLASTIGSAESISLGGSGLLIGAGFAF
jgi:opacity protein-like surface antigen